MSYWIPKRSKRQGLHTVQRITMNRTLTWVLRSFMTIRRIIQLRRDVGTTIPTWTPLFLHCFSVEKSSTALLSFSDCTGKEWGLLWSLGDSLKKKKKKTFCRSQSSSSSILPVPLLPYHSALGQLLNEWCFLTYNFNSNQVSGKVSHVKKQKTKTNKPKKHLHSRLLHAVISLLPLLELPNLLLLQFPQAKQTNSTHFGAVLPT